MAEDAVPDAARADAIRLLAVVHDVLVVLLVCLRPLCWDGQPGQPADLAWQFLVVVGLGLLALERLGGLAATWRWSWRGIIGLALVAALLPAALASPEPAPAWCRWSGWAACIGAAAYLAQVVPGQRVRLALAALLAALGLQAVLAVAQKGWGLPAMAAAQRAGDGAFAGLGIAGGDLLERIANGGVFTTFTLGNQLAAWLALVIPLAVGVAVAGRGGWRIGASALAVAGLVALACADAKSALVAVGLAVAVGWWSAWAGRWWRWLPLPAGVLLAVLAWSSHRLDSSIHVRLGYWRAAVALVHEEPWRGHGLGGFAARYPRLMQPGDEPSRFVHDEPLEAAVAGGAWLGGLAALAILALAWPRRRDDAPAADGERQVHPAVPWVLAGAIPYIALVFAALDGNIGWWPGVAGAAPGDALTAKLAWAVLLGVGTAWLCGRMLRAPSPPAWIWPAALATCACGPLIDFDFHAGGYLGTALVVACLAPGSWRTWRGRAAAVPALLAALAFAVVMLSGMLTGRRLVEADELLARLNAARTDAEELRSLARAMQLDPDDPPALVSAVLDRAWEQAAGAPATRLNVLQLSPPGQVATARALELAAADPDSSAVALHAAQRLLGERRWSEAAALAEHAAGRAPTSPRILVQAAAALERADAEQPSLGQASRAAALRAEAARLDPLVDGKLRERSGASTVPR